MAANDIPRTGTLYFAYESQLGAIADIIKEQSRQMSVGKNICPGENEWFYVKGDQKYAFSADVHIQEENKCEFAVENDIIGNVSPAVLVFAAGDQTYEAGETIRYSIVYLAYNMSKRMKVRARNNKCTLSNIQVEEIEGNGTATEYEAYQGNTISFPDEFIETIEEHTVNTEDATAIDSDIRKNKTAYTSTGKVLGKWEPFSKISYLPNASNETLHVYLPAGSYAQNATLEFGITASNLTPGLWVKDWVITEVVSNLLNSPCTVYNQNGTVVASCSVSLDVYLGHLTLAYISDAFTVDANDTYYLEFYTYTAKIAGYKATVFN